MNLATRCAACGTVFRVVTDQLRVSEGWVRCGRCDAVFNAAQTLFDIDAGTPVQVDGLAAPDAAAGGAAPAAPPTARPAPAAPDDDPLADVVPADWQQHQQRQELARRIASNDLAGALLRQASAPADSAAGGAADGGSIDGAAAGSAFAGADADAVARHGRRPAPARRRSATARLRHAAGALGALAGRVGRAAVRRAAAPAAATPTAAQAAGRTALDGHAGDHPPDAGPEASATAAADTTDAHNAAPSFLLEADRAAFWRRPVLRAGMLAASTLLGALLLVQLAWLWRDPLAARLPVLAAPLRGLCQLSGCQVQALRRIDQISVDSSGLNRVDNSPYYRFSVLVRNRADTALLAPALDLSLTDNLGALVARRVFRLGELGISRDVLERGQELPIQVLLATGERPVAGYTLELFYP
jgi:predicted Zn finger-like uncharacterized protein